MKPPVPSGGERAPTGEMTISPAAEVLNLTDVYLFHAFDECVLENFFCVLSFPDASGKKVEEPAVVCQQLRDDCFSVWSSRLCGHT